MRMICPRCGSEKVSVQIETVSSKTRTRRMGCLWGLIRLLLIVCTCGLWLLIGRRGATSKTKYHNKTAAVCQSCAHKWYP